MAQKVNPIAVRLKFNRFDHSSWFSDYYYSTLLYQDLSFRQYLSSIKQPNANKLGFRPAKSIIHHFPKRSLIHLFCLSDPRPSVVQSTYGSRKVALGRISCKQPVFWGEQQQLGQVGNICQHMRSIWFERTSILHKKKALVNLHRGVAENWTHLYMDPHRCGEQIIFANKVRDLAKGGGSSNETSAGPVYCKQKFSNVETKKGSFAMLRNHRTFETLVPTSRLRTFWPLRQSSILSKPEADSRADPLATGENFLSVFPGEMNWTGASSKLVHQQLDAKRGEHRCKASLANLNFYALHYFFMQKTNNFYDKQIWRSLLKRFAKENASHVLKAEKNNGCGDSRFNTFFSERRGFGFGLSFFNFSLYGSAPFLGEGSFRSQITRTQDFYLSNVQSILSQYTNTFISMRPILVAQQFQCASLVAQEIACKLEQKKSFRLICRLILSQLAACKYIKGIRITCSGRHNGAEIAKTECRKNGETSLHVFSDKIDYAQTKASTPYGILGVKVWVSYI